MTAQVAIEAGSSLFFLGMIWLRTRLQYRERGAGTPRLAPAGRIYFGAVVATLVAGWLLAPVLGRLFWPATGINPTLLRVVWFLATYYVFIAVHRILQSRGAAVFRVTPARD
ncbi:MAG TPA: hypothetical protein VLX90_00940 [Steroidobacteraceae bacterium]|nr:hypothetical protein [Steroidobacteraceae bacterium]